MTQESQADRSSVDCWATENMFKKKKKRCWLRPCKKFKKRKVSEGFLLSCGRVLQVADGLAAPQDNDSWDASASRRIALKVRLGSEPLQMFLSTSPRRLY